MHLTPNILIVDDKIENLIVLERIFAGFNAHLVRALSGRQALMKMDEQDFALVLLDVQMPVMDGFETLKIMRQNKRTESIPVIFISAIYSDTYYLTKGIETGAVDFITKPFEPSILRGKVSIHLEMYRQRMSLQEAHDNLEELVKERTRKLEDKIREVDEKSDDLKKSERKYRRLVENLRDEYFFYSHGTNGVFTYLSPSVTDMLGYTQDEFMTHFTEYLTESEINKNAHIFTERCLQGEEQPPYELEIYHKDGSRRSLEIKEFPVFNGKNRVTSVEGLAHDITERTHAENRTKASLHEKEILLKEIHHRVKNNMQVITSLLSLQLTNVEDPRYQEMFRESYHRIRSMALVHENLFQSITASSINLKEYINNLAENLFQAYDIPSSKILLKTDIDDIMLNIDTAIPSGLIINELFTNSIKHGFPDDRKGEIIISFHRSMTGDAKEFDLIYMDTGVGIPSHIDFDKPASLGLQLVRDLTMHQLSGEICLSRKKGTEIRIHIGSSRFK